MPGCGKWRLLHLFLVIPAYKWARLWFLRFLPTGAAASDSPLVNSFHYLGEMEGKGRGEGCAERKLSVYNAILLKIRVEGLKTHLTK